MSAAVNVNDARPRGFFIVDNAIIRQHGKALGPYGVAVYSALCMYAGRDGRCTPSYRTIGADLDVSPRQVMREVDKIVGLGLARVDHRPTGEGRLHKSNVYTLLPVSVDCDYQSGDSDSQSQPIVTTSHRVVTHSHTNKTQEQEQEQEQDIAANAAPASPMTSIPSTEAVAVAPSSPIRQASAEIDNRWHPAYSAQALDLEGRAAAWRSKVGKPLHPYGQLTGVIGEHCNDDPAAVVEAWRRFVAAMKVQTMRDGRSVWSIIRKSNVVEQVGRWLADGGGVAEDLGPGRYRDPVTGRLVVDWRVAR